MFSYDKGKSWSVGEYIYSNEISYDMGYPSTIELNDGSLATIFYATEDTGVGAKIMQQKWKMEF
jgi:hypothetical protein